MMHLDHIEELRAELTHSILTRRERAKIERELKAALAARNAENEPAHPEGFGEALAA